MRTLARGRRPREAGVHCGSSCRSRAEGKAAVKRLLLALLMLSSLLGAVPAWAEELCAAGAQAQRSTSRGLRGPRVRRRRPRALCRPVRQRLSPHRRPTPRRVRERSTERDFALGCASFEQKVEEPSKSRSARVMRALSSFPIRSSLAAKAEAEWKSASRTVLSAASAHRRDHGRVRWSRPVQEGGRERGPLGAEEDTDFSVVRCRRVTTRCRC